MKKLRDILKMNSINDGTRSLFESIAIPEVGAALKKWKDSSINNCVLIGGCAVSYYTKPRGTTDVDMLFLSQSDIPDNVDGFKKTRSGAFQHNTTHVEVEIISPEKINLSKKIVDKVFQTSHKIDGINVASPSALVALKLHRMMRYDEGDIVGLAETGKVNLDGWFLTKEQLEVYDNILVKNKLK